MRVITETVEISAGALSSRSRRGGASIVRGSFSRDATRTISTSGLRSTWGAK